MSPESSPTDNAAKAAPDPAGGISSALHVSVAFSQVLKPSSSPCPVVRIPPMSRIRFSVILVLCIILTPALRAAKPKPSKDSPQPAQADPKTAPLPPKDAQWTLYCQAIPGPDHV